MDRELQQIMSTQDFQTKLKNQIAHKIASEITQNIKVTYQQETGDQSIDSY